MMTIPLEERIIYEKNDLIVVNKPDNLPSTGRTLADNDCLQYQLILRQNQVVWAIHQLDADTSGVNLFTTDKKLVKKYKEAMEKKNAQKTYLAIVHGNPDWKQHEEFSPIGKVSELSLGISSAGKSAHSKFTVISKSAQHCLLKVNIYSGRTHQIRIHLSHLGFPLIGEEWYRSPACLLHNRQALHCFEIDLLSLKQRYRAPLPLDLQQLAQNIGLNIPHNYL